ncbi:hypothetical protein FACS1894214_5110 [Planctomycetales bacterium]|nr:hypothetical protein FACS1894214_5110 [Planctomycetales bacterium]
MKFMQHDLCRCTQGQTVEIQLSGSAANVQLLDSSNLSNYKQGRQYRYIGGLAKRSPVRLRIPHSGHWYVAVDLRGLRGNVSSSARILPGQLKEIKQMPLASIPSLVQKEPIPNPDIEGDYIRKEFDVFISHASEDKDELVRPLALALRNGGLEVWYDEFEMKIGDSLRRKIDKGLAKSRFGIVVLSRSFLSKGWTNYELDGIVTRMVSGEQIMLPIWHNISKQEVIDFSPSLADKLARNTAITTVEEIATEIIEVIRNSKQ